MDKAECVKLIDEEFAQITNPYSTYEWFKKPLAIGFTSMEVIDCVFEDKQQAPWIYYELQEPKLSQHIVPGFHRPGCGHQRSIKSDQMGSSSAKVSSQTSIEVERMTSTLCGLGGIIPDLISGKLCGGNVEFQSADPPCAKISYAYVEENDAESPSEALLHCQRILERVTALVSWLQSSEIICTHINILRHEPKTGTIQVKHLPLGYIAKLKALINDHLASRGIRSRQLLDASLELLLEQPVEGLSEQILEDSFSAIDGCTVAVQMICVALLSSSQAHLGGIRPFFLDHVLERFELRGVEGPISKHISISLGLMSLTCMGDMLGTQVMAFSSGELVTQDSERYDLGASMDDVFDLWGPGRVIQADSPPFKFEIGGGCIYQPVGSTKFHWIAGQPDSEPAEVEVISEKITIGALVVINEHCRSQPNPNEHNTVPRQNITREVRALGTQPEGWALQQIQAGFQGGYIITPTVNATWIKRHPRAVWS